MNKNNKTLIAFVSLSAIILTLLIFHSYLNQIIDNHRMPKRANIYHNVNLAEVEDHHAVKANNEIDRSQASQNPVPQDMSQIEQIEEAVIAEINKNYPDDANVFLWQMLPTVTLNTLDDVVTLVNTIPIGDQFTLSESQKKSLRQTVVQTIYPILANSPTSYLDYANQRNETISASVGEQLLNILKSHNLAFEFDMSPDTEKVFNIFWKNTLAQSNWSGASSTNAKFRISTFRGGADAFKNVLIGSLKEMLPKCKTNTWQNYHRMALPQSGPDKYLEQNTEITYAELVIYIKHQGVSTLTVPYMLQFWLEPTSNAWHPIQMGCGSNRDLGRLIF